MRKLSLAPPTPLFVVVVIINTTADLDAVSERWLGTASWSLVHFNRLDTSQEDEVQVGVQLKVCQQRRDPRRRVDLQ